MNIRAHRPTLVTAWSLYEQGIPPQAGIVQRDETQKAFYSGAFAALKVFEALVSNGSVVSGQTHALLRALEAEAEAEAPDYASLLHGRRVP